ncbi:ABC transporter permease [Alkaliphilus transvaalensis]|uniref:ABC transporter permease n=1 Tax=Alkaliphilus transvaalensis TaxID=114628 RepID=UPI000685DB38|nr:ABC transporter permease [Alkaliphilus transvaalensis]
MDTVKYREINEELFAHVGKNLEAAEAIKRPSLTYFQDASRRLKKNKVAIFSLVILSILIIMSIIGPILSASINGHTYRRQDLSQQNQTPIMSNARSIMMTANDVFSYKKYRYNFRKTKLIFTNVQLKSAGKIALKVGNQTDEAWQGDRKEYHIAIEVVKSDTWSSILQKLNNESDAILKEDPSFRGVNFEIKGSKLVVSTPGERWINKTYWFGTDEFGRDLFTRLWEGGRVSFAIAFLSVFITSIFGIIYGGISGYFGGRLDDLLMRFVEVLMTVPDMLYIILLLTVMKPGFLPIIIVLTVTSWMGTARIVRGEVMRLKHSEYVLASKGLGADSKRIIFKHLIPNTMGPIIVNMTMMIPRMIFAEAFLSFIGLGIPVPYASWGVLANQGAQIFRQFPHQLLIPGITISLTMLAFNLLGDGLRDALDPRLRK